MASPQTILILRDYAKTPYNRLPRDIVEDPTLSCNAKWILLYLLSKPADWTLRVTDLTKNSTMGNHAVRYALQELRKAGYAKFTQSRTKGLYGDGVWEISDSPLWKCVEIIKNPLFSPEAKNGNAVNGLPVFGTLQKESITETDLYKNSSAQTSFLAKPPNHVQTPSPDEAQTFISKHCPNIEDKRPDLLPILVQTRWHAKNKAGRLVPILHWKSFLKAFDRTIAKSHNHHIPIT